MRDEHEEEILDMPAEAAEGSEQTDAAAPARAEAQPDSAKSSDAQDATEDDSSLSLVRAVGDQAKGAAEGASSAQGEEGGQQPEAKLTQKERDDVDFTDVPFHKHKRFQEVLGRMKSAEDDAGRYQAVQKFMDDQGLSGAEGANALVVAGLMKSDPAKAWEVLQPMLQDLLVRAGEVLPPELEAEVQAGRMTRDGALQITRSRAQVSNLTQRQQTEAERRREAAELERSNSFVTAATDWEAERRTKDPNFDAKVPLIEREVTWLQRTEGRPDTAAGVRDQLRRAYEAANKQFRPATPAPRQPRPMTPVRGGQSPGAATPAADSTLDIVRNRNRAR